MDAPVNAVQDVENVATTFLQALSDHLPSLLMALVIFFIGWLIARAARGGARHFADYLNRFLDRSMRWGGLASARVPSTAIAIIGDVFFWAVILLTIGVAARVAGVAVFAVWFDEAAVQFPHFVIGTMIILIGWAIASRVGGSGDGGESISRRCAQVLIIALSMIIGFEQIGLDMTLPVVLLGIALGATFLAFSVAFGLGAREYVSANIASRALATQLQRGMRIKVDAFEGDLIEITTTHLLLDTEEGHVLVPLSNALSAAIVIRRSADAEQTDDR